MKYYHIIAILPGGKKRIIFNQDKKDIDIYVASYILNRTITTSWGKKKIIDSVFELRIYRTEEKWNRKETTYENFIKNKKDFYPKIKEEVEEKLGNTKSRVFIIMPIQGKEHGSQDEQRIFKEYDERYQTLYDLLNENYNCIAIRIDKEYPLDEEVKRIKEEIGRSLFVIADLTDERPSCYFEAGFAEGINKNILYIASEYSICDTKKQTKIHFDIHMHINYFTNHQELKEIIKEAIEKNKDELFKNQIS